MVRDGYKQTEVGVIPEDWRVEKIGELFNFLSTATYSRSDMSLDGDFMCIHYGDIHTKYNTHVDATKATIPFVTKKQWQRYASLKDGDLIIADASEDLAGVGRSIEIINSNGNVISGLHTILLREKSDFFKLHYKGYITSNGVVKRNLELVSVGTKVYSLTKSQLSNTYIPIPTTAEQENIASALGDVDGLISLLERLLEKKKAIKQGAMQTLLRPKDGWVNRKLKDICQTSSGGTPSRSQKEYYEGNIPWLTTSELNNSLIENSKEAITEIALQNSSAKLFPINSVLVAMYGATIGKLGILKIEATTNQACCALILHNDMDYRFIFYSLLYRQSELVALGSGAGQPNISQKIIRDYSIPIPSLHEQQLIAKILSDMDKEIKQIEKRISKAKSIKEGMMQQLLTGAIRLL